MSSPEPNANQDETVGEEASPLGDAVLVEKIDAEGLVTTEALEWTAPVLARVDDQDTLPHALLQRVQKGPRRPLAEVKEPITGTWRTVTAGQFWEYVNKIAQGLIGKQVGAVVEIKVPSGIIPFEIISISM